MTSNDDAASSSADLVSITAIRPIVQSLLIVHTFLILLVPLIFALFVYSTPLTRRSPIFVLNVIILFLSLSLGTVLDVAGIYAIFFPKVELPPTMFIACGATGIFLSMLVDVILLARLAAVYPPAQVGVGRFMRITLLPIILKVVRVTNLVIFLVIIINALNDPTNSRNPYTTYFASPNLKIEWAAQIVDNAYPSILFIRSIRNRATSGPRKEDGSDGEAIGPSKLTQRLRVLFRIAVSNFVIPTVFSVVLLAVSFHDVTGDYVGDIVYVNSMVSACGVVFATVWAGMDGQRRNVEVRKQPPDLEKGATKRLTNNTFGACPRPSGSHPRSSSSFTLGGTHSIVMAPQGNRLELSACPREDGISDLSTLDLGLTTRWH